VLLYCVLSLVWLVVVVFFLCFYSYFAILFSSLLVALRVSCFCVVPEGAAPLLGCAGTALRLVLALGC